VRPLLFLLIAASAIAAVAVVIATGRAKHEDRAQPVASGAAAAPASRFAGAVLPRGLRATGFALRDQDGRRVTLSELRGRPVAVALLSTRCDSCPVLAQQIKGALDDLRRPVPALAISLDPAGDTPERARRFLAAVGMTGRMRFLLGSRRELAPVWRGFGVRPRRRRQDARLVLLDARGVERVGFPAAQTTPERVAHDLRALGAG
jgi:protein SCO1/2